MSFFLSVRLNVFSRVLSRRCMRERARARAHTHTHKHTTHKRTNTRTQQQALVNFSLARAHTQDSRWSSRLEALFSAHDADGDGNLDVREFSQMLQKVDEGESALHSLLLHRGMYSQMCMFPRVDASVFVKV